jgi:hypothetical protein
MIFQQSAPGFALDHSDPGNDRSVVSSKSTSLSPEISSFSVLRAGQTLPTGRKTCSLPGFARQWVSSRSRRPQAVLQRHEHTHMGSDAAPEVQHEAAGMGYALRCPVHDLLQHRLGSRRRLAG